MIRKRDKMFMVGTVFMLLQGAVRADLIGPGDIAFIGFNSDTPDAFAIVALSPIGGGAMILFSDNEPSSSTAFSTGEGVITWTTPVSGITEGTVVRFSDVDSAAASVDAGLGSVSRSGNFNLANDGDAIYAAFSNAASISNIDFWLAAVANDDYGLEGTGNIGLTTLTIGLTAVEFKTGTPDAGQYTGSRNIAPDPYSGFLSLIGDTSNWTTSDVGTTVVPFDNTSFVANPEPSPFVLMIVALFGFGLLRLKRRKVNADCVLAR